MTVFMGKIECKNYPKVVWNSMLRKQQMQVRKLHEQQGIKPATKHTNAKARIAALEAQLMINSQPKEGDAKQKDGETPREPERGKNRGNPNVTQLTSGVKCKEPV